MIQFNLLPDVKLEYIKATYRRRIISLICFVVAAVFLVIFVMMFMFVRYGQTRQLSNLDKDIKSSIEELRQNKDLDKILTVQNQLDQLPKLHESKVMTSRFFDYLTLIKPNQVFVTDSDLDTEAKSIMLKGQTDSIASVNKFVDTIKFTKYSVKKGDQVAQEGNAFKTVVLQNFTIGASGNDPAKSVNFEISFNYDEAIFVNSAEEGKPLANAVTITVPSIISTSSETQKPSVPSTVNPDQGNGGAN